MAEVVDKKSKSGTDVVTEVDRNIEIFLATELQKIESRIVFVGEEFGGDRSAERYWLVDPIDGTGLYIRGLTGATTMVSLIEDGEVVFGCIYDFVSDTLYYAIKGQGAYKNESLIHVSDLGFGYAYIGYESKLTTRESLQKYFAVREHCMPLKYMCAGWEYVLVATGQIEGRINYVPYGTDYDFAPGTLLVKEAGGIVTNIGKQTFDFRNLDSIAANPVLHKQLTEGSDALFPITE